MPEHLAMPPKHNIPEPPEHLEDYRPLGADAVQAEEGRVDALLHEDYLRRAGAYVVQFEGTPDPRYHRVRQHLLRAVGKPKPNEELTEWLDATNQFNLRYVPMHLEEAAESYATKRQYREIRANYGLEGTRATLEHLGMAERAHVQEYFKQSASEYFTHGYSEWSKTHDGDVIAWLTEAREGENRNARLLNFLQWHNHYVEQLNRSPETRARITAEKAAYKERINRAVRTGTLPDAALEAKERVDRVPMLIGDAFDTTVREARGLFDQEKKIILLAKGAASDTAIHEMNHAVFGGFRDRIWNEAVTDHVVDVLEGKTSGSILLGEEARGYPDRRAVVSASLADTGIGMVTVLEAYCEPDRDGPKHAELDRQLLEAYRGYDVRDFAMSQYMQRQYELSNARLEAGAATREAQSFTGMARNVSMFGMCIAGESEEKIVAAGREIQRRNLMAMNYPEAYIPGLLNIAEEETREMLKTIQRYVDEHAPEAEARLQDFAHVTG